MRFESVPLEEAIGKILGHNIAGSDGRRALRKGKPLEQADIAKLKKLGRDSVYVAILDGNDIEENQAALQIAEAVAGLNTTLSRPTTGRANILADHLGLLRVDTERLMQVNMLDSVTLATIGNHSVVSPRQMVATLKVISYGVPNNIVREAVRIGQDGLMAGRPTGPIIRVDQLEHRRVGLILSGSPTVKERIVAGFTKALAPRLQSWGSDIDHVAFIPLEDEQGEVELANEIERMVANQIDLIILAGETAIMDRFDIAPRAVERSGGRVTCFGAPVDPGNLLMLARHDAGPRSVQIIGAPGCARSPKRNIIDLVIPRLLVGDYLTKIDIVQMGIGGMLDDVIERGRPRKLN